MERIALSTVAFILGVVFRSIAPPLVDFLQSYIAKFVVTRKLKVGTRSGLGGNWNHIWYAKGSSSWPDVNEGTIALSAIGRRFAGIWEYKGKNWLVSGVLGLDNIVTGTWREMAPNGYRGTWICKCDLNQENMTGWYLGTSNRGPTGVGEWIWWREGSNKPALPEPLIQAAPR